MTWLITLLLIICPSSYKARPDNLIGPNSFCSGIVSPQRSNARPNFPTSNVVGGATFVWHPGYLNSLGMMSFWKMETLFQQNITTVQTMLSNLISDLLFCLPSSTILSLCHLCWGISDLLASTPGLNNCNLTGLEPLGRPRALVFHPTNHKSYYHW